MFLRASLTEAMHVPQADDVAVTCFVVEPEGTTVSYLTHYERRDDGSVWALNVHVEVAAVCVASPAQARAAL